VCVREVSARARLGSQRCAPTAGMVSSLSAAPLFYLRFSALNHWKALAKRRETALRVPLSSATCAAVERFQNLPPRLNPAPRWRHLHIRRSVELLREAHPTPRAPVRCMRSQASLARMSPPGDDVGASRWQSCPFHDLQDLQVLVCSHHCGKTRQPKSKASYPNNKSCTLHPKPKTLNPKL